MNAGLGNLMAWPAVVAFVIVSSIVLAIGKLLQGNNDRRLRARLSESGAVPVPRSRGRTVANALPRIGARLLPNNERQRTQLRSRLSRAGIYAPLGVAAYLALRFSLRFAAPPALLVAVFWGYLDLCWAAVAACAGFLAPELWLGRVAARRQLVLAGSLPDFLDLLVACLEGGQSVQAAMQRVSDELRIAHPVLSQEMSVVQREIELGGTPAAALRRCADRSGTESIRSLGAFVEQTQRFGTTLVDALRDHADLLRTQREQRAEERAQRAAVKILFPTLLFIFPAIFVVLAGPAAIQLHEHFSRSSNTFSTGGGR